MTKRLLVGLTIVLGFGATLAVGAMVLSVPPVGSDVSGDAARIASLREVGTEPVDLPPAARPRDVTVPAGTRLYLRLADPISSDQSRVEDPVSATLTRPVVVDGITVAPSGSRVTGVVTQARRSGKVKGRAYLAMRFTSLSPRGADERYRLRTRVWAREAPGTKKDDAVKIGVPAGAGAAVGAIVGGKKGAGIGAAVGGGAGTAAVLSTRGDEVRLGRGATVIVRLAEPVTVRGLD